MITIYRQYLAQFAFDGIEKHSKSCSLRLVQCFLVHKILSDLALLLVLLAMLSNVHVPEYHFRLIAICKTLITHNLY